MKSLILLAVAVSALFPVSAALDRTKFNIGTYRFGDKVPGFRTEAHVRELKEAGIDYICSMRPGADAEAFYRTLDLFEKYGVGVITEGGTDIGAACPVKAYGRVREHKPLDPSVYEKAAKKFRTHKALWGLDVGDEPSGIDMANLGKAVEIVRRLHPDQFQYVNLFPSYARMATNAANIVDSQLGAASYRDYIDEYCRYVPLDYISFDIYPYSQSMPKGIGTFFNNLKIVADACLRTGKALWFVGQCNSWGNLPMLTANQLRYQAYVAMAFGAETCVWACWTPGWWNNNVYTKEGEKTAMYDRVREVNRELHALGDVFMKYRRTATHVLGYEGRFSDYLKGSELVSGASASTGYFRDLAAVDGEPLLVAEMVPRNPADETLGTQALLIVTSEDPCDLQEKDRVIRFRSLRRNVCAVGVDGGALAVGRDAAGFLSVTLRSNRAALVWSR